MTTHHIYLPDGSSRHGDLHSEIAEPSLAILKRDLRKFRKHSCASFVRKPYHDLDEVEISLAMVDQRREVAAVMVTRLIHGHTNARIFLTQSMLDDEIAKGKSLDLYSKPFGKGFGGK